MILTLQILGIVALSLAILIMIGVISKQVVRLITWIKEYQFWSE